MSAANGIGVARLTLPRIEPAPPGSVKLADEPGWAQTTTERD